MLQCIRRLLLHVQNLAQKGVCKIRDSKVIPISGKNTEEAQLHLQLDFPLGHWYHRKQTFSEST